ncbi:MAG: hypothetical protein CO001_02665 [Candidatus Portnoybacteria bacterium CG_4_8_14_3_um_filter_40_10]|uniref:Uncharacterized protein n=4 Tax=Candidatus Portnoyibacteriota TaxID=1817913 RepID=A0A2M7II69_9BACT|nr:MAG: hypothetical protein COV84_03880 [Candidatus Portnoybacteria bacterium CG11_big_fil_rev_8_21_14_0_20_40_15]PIS31831.1 MAG: hypothetical protein COT41_00830 [Candidatus Portnoybacteria bacterium CG08_land_8_20_14_0_20_40_83]PIW76181.1 MAG: hypothetical protein CO001_02665 [Candidatus Portnoybacteria bacterium CG_4_8_14_3_um_filter_40_10]PIY74048.1 MAG: hypothetical protein COY85_04360 [Candidatus Portnoybacteria bacterium CG_4_10_14_0_8_um_filter_40_50]PJA64660.1 MAG: hypothetical protei
MAISAVFKKHCLAVDACGDLDDLDCIVEPGRDKRKGPKKETQLIIDLPECPPEQVSKLEAKVEQVVEKYGGLIVR